MQSCILTLGIILAGQVATSDNRYAPVVPPSTSTAQLGAPPASMQQPPMQQSNTPATVTQPAENPLRTSTPPARPATSPPAATSAPQPKLTKVVKPADLLRSLVQASAGQQLPGIKLSLGDAVQGSRSRAEQSQRVDLYWQLSRSLSDYRLASLEEMQIQAQKNGLLQPSTEWTVASESATGRKKVAYAAVQAAQYRLQRALGRTGQDSLPVPTDLPHCGDYQTKYEQIFQGRTSREARQLATLLPLRHEALGQASADTTAAQQWHSLVNRQRGTQGDARLLLKAYEQLALQRREFVSAAYRYNEDIARYTELAVPQEVGTSRLVAMLIQTSDSTAGWQRGPIQRASAEEPAGQGQAVDRYKPKTFADQSDDLTQRAATAPAGSERSILVKP